jgi:hypothetical protein
LWPIKTIKEDFNLDFVVLFRQPELKVFPVLKVFFLLDNVKGNRAEPERVSLMGKSGK